MRASAVERFGVDFMHSVNSHRLPGFASGGPVGPMPLPMLPSMPAGAPSSSATPQVNIINQGSGPPQRGEAKHNPRTGSTDIIMRDLDSGLAKRAGSGRGDLARVSNISPAASRVG